MKVKSESEVAQLCPTSLRPHGPQPTGLLHPWIVQARALEWGAIAFSIPSASVLNICLSMDSAFLTDKYLKSNLNVINMKTPTS